MKNLKLTTRSSYSPRAFLLYVATPVMIALCMSAASTLQAHAFVQLTSQLDLGDRNAQVTSLQEFLASMPDVYPQGLVTGYFGPLTKSAVMNFQAKYGVVSSGTPTSTGYGRVGPLTITRINSMMSGGSSSLDTTGPAVSMSSLPQVTNTAATFSVITNENTNVRVIYNAGTPLMFNEGDMNSNGFSAIGGFGAISQNNSGQSHTVTVSNLNPNTVYYYTVIARDAAGNASVVGPNNSFRTNQ